MKRILILLVVPTLVLVGCKHKAESVSDNSLAVPVKTSLIVDETLNSIITLSGNVEGDKTIRLGFLVAGKVNNIAVSEGLMVGKGDLIASLDGDSYALAKDIADASLNQVEDDYKRVKMLNETQSVTASDFSKISNGYKQASANQKLQSKNLADTRIYAPISGVVIKKGVEVGEIIGAGMPLFAISSIDKVKVNAALPESELHLVRVNQVAMVYVSALDSIFTGKIIEIGALAEPTTRSFAVKIEIDNGAKLLRPGMIAEIKIASSKTVKALLLPLESIMHDVDNQSYVFVIDPALNKSFKRKIRLGSLMGNKMEVVGGVKSGEMVVVGGQQKLNDGTTVILK